MASDYGTNNIASHIFWQVQHVHTRSAFNWVNHWVKQSYGISKKCRVLIRHAQNTLSNTCMMQHMHGFTGDWLISEELAEAGF